VEATPFRETAGVWRLATDDDDDDGDAGSPPPPPAGADATGNDAAARCGAAVP
jgi:hypothetical protein